MNLAKQTAIVSMMALLLSLPGAADAARANKKAAGMHTVSGMVMHKNKAVSGAHVHVKRKHKARAASAKVQTAAPKVARAHTHGGTMSAANGAFRLKHRRSGTITLEAHKKGVGKGHTKVAAGTSISGVMIRLHKHHHNHA